MDNLKILFRLYRQYTKMDLLWFLPGHPLLSASNLFRHGMRVLYHRWRFPAFRKIRRLRRHESREILFMMGFSTLVDRNLYDVFIGNNTSMISRIIGRGAAGSRNDTAGSPMGRAAGPGLFPAVWKQYAYMRNRTDDVCSQTATLSATLPWLLLLLIYAVSSTILVLSVMTLLSCADILRTCGSRGDRPDRQGFIYFSEDLSAGHDEPFSQTAVPDRASSGTGRLVSIGAAFKSRERRLWRCAAFLQACYLPAAALALSLFTIYVFKKGMKYYAVNGSPRYSGFGHR